LVIHPSIRATEACILEEKAQLRLILINLASRQKAPLRINSPMNRPWALQTTGTVAPRLRGKMVKIACQAGKMPSMTCNEISF
jgi:hypothetical protein